MTNFRMETEWLIMCSLITVSMKGCCYLSLGWTCLVSYCITPKQINPIEIDVHGIKETEYQEVIKKLLVFKYTDEGSLEGMGRLYKTEEFLYMEIMKIFYRMFDLIICKEPKITCTAVSLPMQNFSMRNFTKLCPFLARVHYIFWDKLKKTNGTCE